MISSNFSDLLLFGIGLRQKVCLLEYWHDAFGNSVQSVPFAYCSSFEKPAHFGEEFVSYFGYPFW